MNDYILPTTGDMPDQPIFRCEMFGIRFLKGMILLIHFVQTCLAIKLNLTHMFIHDIYIMYNFVVTRCTSHLQLPIYSFP
jgi:hypothetical protein